MSKKRETAKERRTRVAGAALAHAHKVFMDYHEDSSWAAEKLQSGTAPLTPESIKFMEQELTARAIRKAKMAEIDKELAAEKPPANPVGGTRGQQS